MVSCCAPNCNNKSENGWKLFRFPAGPRKAIWVKNMCRDDDWTPNQSSRLCEEHFDVLQFESGRLDGWSKLKPNAIPKIFLVPHSSPLRKSSHQKSSSHESPKNVDNKGGNTRDPVPSTSAICSEELCEEIMELDSEDPGVTCVIKGCSSDTRTEPDVGYFPFPTSKVMLRKWLKACNLKNEKLQPQNIHICAKHFIEEDFITELRIEGEETICIRELRNDVVPTVNLTLKIITSVEEGEIATNKIDYSDLLLENEKFNEKIKELEPKLQFLRSCKKVEEEKYMKLSKRCNKLKQESVEKVENFVSQKMLLSQIFSETQMKALTTHRKVKWAEHDYAIAYTIRYLSNRHFYTYFTETLGYPFPCKSTLQKWKKVKEAM